MSVAGESLALGVIGFGRVGAALASALHAAGHPVAAITARSEAARERAEVTLPGTPVMSPQEVAQAAGLVFVTVPDDAIGPTVAELAGVWRPGQVVAHASGALGLA
ncbi:MAG: NAD(P)-binding domain-containing protein, partial [Bifidobacteriaceae bacterium]|nr:NAD(P)-binding domain-containing protein [Bifidobacteriaceae bacterium]